MNDLTKNISPGKFSLMLRLKSFTYAWSGIKTMLITEHNSRIHLVFTITVLVLGFIFHLSKTEFLLLFIVVSIVWIAELFNTCIEKVLDFLTLQKLPEIKRIKDMAAGAVMLASLSAFVVGTIIFIPKILHYVTLSI
jgi:diacylglycerol kinase (ATP)